jgi:hypothetical protein
MRVIFAGWTRSLGNSQILNELQIVDRLLSYYELHDQDDAQLAVFVETGNWPTKKKPYKQEFSDKRYKTARRLALAKRAAGWRNVRNPCPSCDGWGKVYLILIDEDTDPQVLDAMDAEECVDCGGTGECPKEYLIDG